jgi:isoleucyl-tRNA synthetase
MYQNLVRSVDGSAPESVHHTAWPEVETERIDAGLLANMALARQVVTLGHAARASRDVKVRQPLARALIHQEQGGAALDEELAALVRDELNVKQVVFVQEAGDLVTYALLPDNKLLGPRFGQRFPALRAALAALDPTAVARQVRAGLPVRLTVQGEEVELAPAEVLVREEPREGLAVASERGLLVAVDTVLTPDLAAEGLAREVVRRVQTLRKEAGLNLDDRIVTTFQAEGELAAAIAGWREFIAAETLSVELTAGSPQPGAHTAESKVDGRPLLVGISREAGSRE